MVRFYLRIATFIVGVIVGILLAVQYKSYLNANVQVPEETNPSYKVWFKNQQLKRKIILWDTLRYKNQNFLTESQYLFDKINVLCIVLVRKSKNVNAIKDTWSKGCTDIKFVEIFGKHKKVPIRRSKENSSWILLCTTLRNASDEHHWIVIVNDNTFVIPENLRYYVAHLNSSNRYYLGHAVSFWSINYNSGDAGYVLSRGSLRAFKNLCKDIDCSTNAFWNREDFYLGKYLSRLNITPTDTRDTYGLSTFHPYNWYHVFFPGENYYKNSIFPIKCCSKNSITFQAIEGDKMYTYYYFLYMLQIFMDGHKGNQPFIDSIPEEKVWKEFLKQRNIPSQNVSGAQYYKLWEDLIADPNSFGAHMKKEMNFDYD